MNVHLLSDTPRATSAYANITRNLALGLNGRGHNVTITGFITGYENFQGINVLPLATPFTDPQAQFANNLKSGHTDVLICIHEAHTETARYSTMFKPAFFWVPVEGTGISAYMSQILQSCAGAVPMSKAGQNQLELEGIPCRDTVYPGWDPGIFTKNPKQTCKYSMDIYSHMQDAKTLCQRGCPDCTGIKGGCAHFEQERIMINIGGKEFSGTLQALDSIRNNLGAGIIIGCVAQNTGTRKRLERLIEAFSKTEHKKDALLHLHSFPMNSKGIDLFRIAKEHNVLDRVIFSYSENPVFGISDHGMNSLYNYFDIHATASSYEGFGMPVLESASVGKAQVAPSCGSFPELLGDNERGLLASIATSVLDGDGITRSLVDTGSLAEKMDILCSDAGMRKKLGDAGAEWAKQYTWDKVVKRWDALLTGTVEEKMIVKELV